MICASILARTALNVALAGMLVLATMQARAVKADSATLSSLTRQMQPVGQTTFRFLFWRYFEAELWTANGKFDWQQRMALSLTYHTEFSADELTASTIDEMDRVSDWPRSQIEALRPAIAACMADVRDGDRYLAYSPEPSVVDLYLNDEQKCQLTAPGIRQAYLGIWLSENSRFPANSLALRGEGS